MIDEESLKNIENLHRLKSDGVITDQEFERSKEKILFGAKPVAKASPSLFTQRTDPDDPMYWVTLPLHRYADFQGRSSRKEYWMFQIVYLVLIVGTVIIAAIDKPEYSDDLGPIGTVAVAMLILCILALAVPSIALQVRRFHDQDKSGWFALLNLFPYLGAIAVLVFMCIEGTNGENRFGPKPRRV
jgi:uncharacterized membrane protein YhaH (DUF805 family)